METEKLQNQAIYPVIETERLLLRMFRAEDLDAAFHLFNDADVQKFLSSENRRTREQLKVTLKNFITHWDKRGFGIWCVTDKKTAEVIGYCGFQYFDNLPEIEIVFAFLKDFWGKGFAVEAAKACLRFWYNELASDKMFAASLPKNIAARRVLEKIGMSYVGQSVHYRMDLAVYSIARNKYRTDNSVYKLIRPTLAGYSISNPPKQTSFSAFEPLESAVYLHFQP